MRNRITRLTTLLRVSAQGRKGARQRGRASGVGPAFSTFKVEIAALNGFRAIGTMCAIRCVLVFTNKEWQSPGKAGREMRPNPFVRRVEQ
jgi:hypothetical protein